MNVCNILIFYPKEAGVKSRGERRVSNFFYKSGINEQNENYRCSTFEAISKHLRHLDNILRG
jgi:hypothetical protein